MNKSKLYLLWFSKIMISLLFILASIGKLTNNESVIEMFQEWGYFDGFYFLIGLLELGLAILLVIPKTSIYSAFLLLILMVGALVTHLIHDPIIEVFRPAIFMLFLIIIIYLQWDKKIFQFSRN